MKMSGGISHAALIVVCVIAVPGLAYGDDTITASADVSANAGYSSNPFSAVGSNLGSGYVQARVTPEIKLTSLQSTLTLQGLASYKRYFEHYTDSDDFGARLDYAGKPTARINTAASLRYDNSVIGQNDFFSNPLDTSVTSPPVTSGADLSLYGARYRRQTGQANAGIDIALSSRDRLAQSAFYLVSRYGKIGILANYNGYGETTGFSRQVTQALQLGVQGSISRYDYKTNLGSTTVYSPQATFSLALASEWKLDGALGASFVSREGASAKTTLTGSANLCRVASRSNFCVSGQRAALPNGIGQIQNELLLGMRYSYKLTEHSMVTANVNYTKNSAAPGAIIGGTSYLRSALGYDRRISERVHFTMDARYAKLYYGPVIHPGDFGGQLGIIVKLGRTQ